MNSKIVFLGVVGLAAGLLTACHDKSDGGSNPSPPPSTSLSLSTVQVLARAEATTEVGAPIPVNNGAVTINDTSETSAPIPVNKM